MTKVSRTVLIIALLTAVAGLLIWQYLPKGEDQQEMEGSRAGFSVPGQSGRLTGPVSAMPPGAPVAQSAIRNTAPLSFVEIKQNAERGDPVAQRELSSIYEECLAYSLNSTVYLQGLDDLSKLNPGSTKRMQEIKVRQTTRCAGVDDGAPIPLEAYQLWLEQAARGGDLTARIKLKARSLEEIPAEEVGALGDAAIASKDPLALFELAALMGKPSSGNVVGPLAAVAGSSSRGHAWAITACRMGAPCGARSVTMTSVCISTGRCNYSDYESFIMAEVGASERTQIRTAMDVINRMLSR